jgi:cytokinin dehydrogenase
VAHPSSAGLARALAELDRYFGGSVLARGPQTAAYATDFGGMIEREPAVVLRPSSEADVLLALRVTAEHGVELATRGAGHGQSGQSLGQGLVLDMTSLAQVRLEPGAMLVEAQAGASWLSVVDTTFAAGRLPIGLTQALDTTVAGTLSVAGVGAESSRFGPQADNVAYFDVALLSGEVVRCNHREHRELFDAVRAGLGQCGVVLRVGYPVRRCRARLRRRCFAYTDPARFLRDAGLLAADLSAERWLTATARPGPFGHALLLLLGEEHDEGNDASAPLPQLNADFELRASDHDTWSPGGVPGHGFFRSFAAERNGAYAGINPWVEHLFDEAKAAVALAALFRDFKELLQRSAASVIWLRRSSEPAPLFITPAAPLVFGVGVFARFSRQERPLADAMLGDYLSAIEPLGGKRYLSGYLPPTFRTWTQHYGAAWPALSAAKAKYDPCGLLNAGFLDLGPDDAATGRALATAR